MHCSRLHLLALLLLAMMLPCRHLQPLLELQVRQILRELVHPAMLTGLHLHAGDCVDTTAVLNLQTTCEQELPGRTSKLFSTRICTLAWHTLQTLYHRALPACRVSGIP